MRDGPMSDRIPPIREDRTQLCTIFDALSDGVLVCDARGEVVEINDTACALFAVTRYAAIGRSIAAVVLANASEPPDAAAWFAQAKPGDEAVFEWSRGQGERALWIEMTLRRISLAGQAAGLAVVRDATERRRTIVSLMRAARRDELTGLPNRQDFEDILQHEIARYERYGGYLSIALGQIDEPQALDVQFTRPLAASAFQQVAAFIRGRLRKSDYMARSGSEEFAFLIHDARPDNAARMLNRMRHGLQQHAIPEIGRSLTLCYGLTAYRLGDTPENLLTRMAQAVAIARKTPHHRVVTG